MYNKSEEDAEQRRTIESILTTQEESKGGQPIQALSG